MRASSALSGPRTHYVNRTSKKKLTNALLVGSIFEWPVVSRRANTASVGDTRIGIDWTDCALLVAAESLVSAGLTR